LFKITVIHKMSVAKVTKVKILTRGLFIFDKQAIISINYKKATDLFAAKGVHERELACHVKVSDIRTLDLKF